MEDVVSGLVVPVDKRKYNAEYMKSYYQRPEVKARMKLARSTPEAKARKLEQFKRKAVKVLEADGWKVIPPELVTSGV